MSTPDTDLGQLGDDISEVQGRATLGGGARFWAYISPTNDTASKLSSWQVRIRQSTWVGTIDSGDPQQMLQSPGRAGEFDVRVVASGPNMPEKELAVKAGSNPNIGCGPNCAAMVGIVANADGTDASYWTVWNAFCDPK